MSLPGETTIECPACGTEQAIKFRQSVNVTLDPELKQKLIDRTLVTFTCEHCGETVEVDQDLTYHDMDKRLMIFRGDEAPVGTSGEGLGSMIAKIEAKYTFRLVDSLSQLIENILIRDAGLDDRAVEVFKLLLLKKIDQAQRGNNPELFFGGVLREEGTEEAMGFVLVNESGTMDFSVPLVDMFQRFEAQHCNRLPSVESERGRWVRVDRGYALGYLRSLERDSN